MTTKVITETKPIEFNGAPRATADRGPPVEVVLNSENGRTEPVVEGGKARPGRMAVIEAARARRLARTGAADAPADPAADGMVGSGPAGTEPAVVGSGDAGDVDAAPAATETDGGDAAPEGGDAAPAPEGQPAAATAAPDPGSELERVRGQLEEISRTREAQRVADLDTFIDDPVKALRGWVAGRLGVPEDDAVVNESMGHLAEELTWGQIPAQDLPSDKKAQLDMARWNRTNRLQSHRRKADQGKRTRDDLEQRARDQARRSYDSVRDAHPHLALAAELDGRSVEEIVVNTLVRAAEAGVIRPDASEEAAFKEAIRLAEIQSQQRVTRIATRLAHLAPAPAPLKPGASSKTAATAQQPSSPAAPRAPSPRALTAAKAGAAPSRPAEPAPPKPQKKVIDASQYVDPSDRRQEVLKRHARSRDS